MVFGSITRDLAPALIDRYDLLRGVKKLGTWWEWSELFFANGFDLSMNRNDCHGRAVAGDAGSRQGPGPVVHRRRQLAVFVLRQDGRRRLKSLVGAGRGRKRRYFPNFAARTRFHFAPKCSNRLALEFAVRSSTVSRIVSRRDYSPDGQGSMPSKPTAPGVSPKKRRTTRRADNSASALQSPRPAVAASR